LALGLGAFQEGRYDEAVSHFRQAAQLNPRFSSLQVNLAASLALAGRVHIIKSGRTTPRSKLPSSG
jgi:Flp pilus assembly protein TadD